MGCNSCSTVWIIGLVVVVAVLSGGGAEAKTTCDQVMNEKMKACLFYMRGAYEFDATVKDCCDAATSLKPLDMVAVCTCLRDELVKSPVTEHDRVTSIYATCERNYFSYFLATIFTDDNLPAIDCSAVGGDAAQL